MKLDHVKVLGLAAILAASPPVHAQLKFADMKPSAQGKDVVFLPAKQLPPHGALVAIDLANGDKLQGRVVRYDLNSNDVFVRTKPGAAPVVVSGDSVKQ